ncbi:MAG: hypothetical protein QOE01_1222 [Actinomycetota bacterium]|jgi:hypothetical protein|nr:hypothetical protein [Actinomycetota bacterium]
MSRTRIVGLITALVSAAVVGPFVVVLSASTATATTTSIALDPHKPIALGQSLTITGTLTTDDPAVMPEQLAVTRTDSEGTQPLTGPVSVTGSGSPGQYTLQIDDTPRLGQTNTYDVTYTGATTASGSVDIEVQRKQPGLSVTTDRTTYGYGATAHVRAHLGATYTNRAVSIYAKPYGGTWGLLRSANVDADGYLRTSHVMSRRTVFRVTFTGDARYGDRTLLATRYSRARLVERLHRWYDTSRGYHLYRMSTDPKQTVRVHPGHAGDCIRFRAQRRHNGAWHGVALSGCIALSSTSGAAVLLRGSPVPFEPYRLRAELPSTPKNAATKGRWQLLKFTA